MMRKYALLLTGLLALSACESAKQTLIGEKQAPDEFAVVKRAPLEMPPDFSLRPPSPGAQRPQEPPIGEKAQAVVFGETRTQSTAQAPAKGEDALLQNAGALNAPDDIRNVVDAETANLAPREKPVAEKLLGLAVGDRGKPAASVVDARAEAERLQKNAAEGRPLTDGNTPTIEE